MKLRPLGDRVVVKAIAADEKTKSGIILPGTIEKERHEKGEVTAVGPGRMLEDGKIAPMNVKIGDLVMFKRGYSTDEVKVDGVEHLFISESDILGVIEK